MEQEHKPAADGEPQQGRRIPNTDMQPEDAGTADSGNDEAPSARPTPAEKAMKQESRTDSESGERR